MSNTQQSVVFLRESTKWNNGIESAALNSTC
jgi:hypothetical protein